MNDLTETVDSYCVMLVESKKIPIEVLKARGVEFSDEEEEEKKEDDQSQAKKTTTTTSYSQTPPHNHPSQSSTG